MSLHELAEHLHMTVGEILHGRGTPMSAHELAVSWPMFFSTRAREQRRAQMREEQKQTHRRGRM